ncbi:hypothetical protein [Mycobacteroides salmoniphilum]|uniref:Uncharacterized protein n=1 Tax=Mycobacteroides salmoniphilum TaxID=404941 RepID=A0A4R8SHD2_9MYCO|nr:hypothetical protein [Mycobacteroides salmoniphilum]TDZ96341.1 hypothetical protein CCUG60885_02485 [Mycobacteroides salmoniphilum]TEA05436.1 hypothetical protein CCUG60883_02742 [Mycobacteroides salmoniphilum]
MSDWVTLGVAVVGAVATVTNGFGGYRLAGRNDEAKDIRTAQREEAARSATHAERLQEQRHEWQREVLLQLQDELQKMTRETAKVLMQDLATLRDKGAVFQLPEALGGEASLDAGVAVQRLRSRVIASDLRASVGDFVAFCAHATTGAIAVRKEDPADQLAALLNDLLAQLGTRYNALVEQLGEHIRRELDRP